MHKEKDFDPGPDLTKCPWSGVNEYLMWIRKISWPVGIVSGIDVSFSGLLSYIEERADKLLNSGEYNKAANP